MVEVLAEKNEDPLLLAVPRAVNWELSSFHLDAEIFLYCSNEKIYIFTTETEPRLIKVIRSHKIRGSRITSLLVQDGFLFYTLSQFGIGMRNIDLKTGDCQKDSEEVVVRTQHIVKSIVKKEDSLVGLTQNGAFFLVF